MEIFFIIVLCKVTISLNGFYMVSVALGGKSLSSLKVRSLVFFMYNFFVVIWKYFYLQCSGKYYKALGH
jgi:hypothetical protein